MSISPKDGSSDRRGLMPHLVPFSNCGIFRICKKYPFLVPPSPPDLNIHPVTSKTSKHQTNRKKSINLGISFQSVPSPPWRTKLSFVVGSGATPWTGRKPEARPTDCPEARLASSQLAGLARSRKLDWPASWRLDGTETGG